MSRWHPDARGRLEKAAHELFLAHGFEHTTVADIANRAGLTERTFFRHFSDKREVLFSGSSALRDELVRTVAGVPSELAPIDVVRIAVEAVSGLMHGRREFARERGRIVAAHPDLQERELIKRATLTAALAHALQRRGVPELAANLAADMGMTVFYLGFGRWIEDPTDREFVDVVREGFDKLKAVATGN